MSLDFLTYNERELHHKGAVFTAKEIAGQPALWLKIFDLISQQSKNLQEFLEKVFQEENTQVILTGAGTSAFIGEVLEGPLLKELNRTVRAIPTTDLVTHPEFYLKKMQPILLVSFARSGNSPESVKTVKLADTVCDRIYHLIVTCNPNGYLAKSGSKNNTFSFLLPPEADDQSLAMTGSFSSMLLSGLLLGKLDKIERLRTKVEQISRYGNRVLDNYVNDFIEISNLPFKRAVFLGSGPFRGIARESHLKLQELTDGKVICKHDSFLGFRHGPKAVIDDKTLMVYFISNDPYSQQYEIDLIKAVNQGSKGLFQLAVMESEQSEVEADLNIIMGESEDKVEEEFLSVPFVMPAQILGFFKSLNCNLKPDTPSVSGTITRVVEGVNLYPYNRKI